MLKRLGDFPQRGGIIVIIMEKPREQGLDNEWQDVLTFRLTMRFSCEFESSTLQVAYLYEPWDECSSP